MSASKNKNNNILLILSTFIILVIIVMLIQDFLLSKLFHHPYSLTESLLLKLKLFFLFIPIFIYRPFTNKKISRNINLSRLFIFLIPICIGHILIVNWMIVLISQNYLDLPFTFWYLLQNKFTNDFLFLMTIYGLLFLIARYYSLSVKPYKFNKTLVVQFGLSTKKIKISEIDWIAAETPNVGIWVNNKKYLYHSTLTDIESELDNSQFVRIHDLTIININRIHNIHARANGDYDIQLYDNTLLRLSRDYHNNLKML